MELRIRSSIFFVGQALFTLVFAIPAVLTFPLPFRMRYGFISQWARIVLWWLKLTCRLDFTVEGKEHLPPGPAVVLCKHQSAWETLALQQILPPQVWLLKRELLWIPFFGWGLAMLEPIAIDRSESRKALKQLVEQGKQRLAAGRWVVIFPEGTRVAPGQHKPFNVGGAKLAHDAGFPVVPIVHNAGDYWPRRGFIKRPGTIRLVIGPTIDVADKSAKQINDAAEKWIRSVETAIQSATSGGSEPREDSNDAFFSRQPGQTQEL